MLTDTDQESVGIGVGKKLKCEPINTFKEFLMEWNAEKYDLFQKEYQLKNGLDLLNRLESQTEFGSHTILDIGCGNGELSIILRDKLSEDGRLTAIDRDEGMLDVFRNKTESRRIQIHNSDIINWLASTDEKYDIIFSNAVLHWMETYERLSQVFELAGQCLNPDGILAVRFSLKDNCAASKIFLEKHLRDYLHDSDVLIKRWVFEYAPCISLLEKTGFDPVQTEELKFLPFTDGIYDFQWMVRSQPILNYLSTEKIDEFTNFLHQNWLKNPIKAESHHGVFIARIKKQRS